MIKMMSLKENESKYRLSDGHASINMSLDETVLTYHMLRVQLKEKGMI